MPLFSTEHHRLHYVTAGDRKNPPLLLLHGFLGSHQDFSSLLPTFSRQFYCVVPDLPGHGSTQTKPESYTFSRTAESLLSLLHHLNIWETHLLGYSMGGRLALYLTCEFPDCFIRVVLESVSPGLKTAEEREKRRKHDDAIAHRLQTTPLAQFLTQWYQNPLFSSLHRYPQGYADMFQRRQQNSRDQLAKAISGFSTGRQPSLWPSLPMLDIPLLLLVGELDAKFVAIGQDMMANTNTEPPSALKMVERCGHNIHLESPTAFMRLVVVFLLVL